MSFVLGAFASWMPQLLRKAHNISWPVGGEDAEVITNQGPNLRRRRSAGEGKTAIAARI